MVIFHFFVSVILVGLGLNRSVESYYRVGLVRLSWFQVESWLRGNSFNTQLRVSSPQHWPVFMIPSNVYHLLLVKRLKTVTTIFLYFLCDVMRVPFKDLSTSMNGICRCTLEACSPPWVRMAATISRWTASRWLWLYNDDIVDRLRDLKCSGSVIYNNRDG